MQYFLLAIHSLLRWALFAAMIMVLIQSYKGWKQMLGYTKQNSTYSLILMILADIQLLIGLIMYFFTSDYLRAIKQDMGTAMKDSVQRFWAVEHIFGMIIGIALIHIGRVYTKKNIPDATKHKMQFIFLLIAMAIIAITVPWPFMAKFANRGWFPGL